MPSLELTLFPVLLPLFLGAVIGILAGSIYVGGGAAAVMLAFIAVHTANSFAVGAWFLLLLLMALAAGKRTADMVLGETA